MESVKCDKLLSQKKIDKRGRKLIDFDAERHAVQQMQNNPNRNEAKFVRAKVTCLFLSFVENPVNIISPIPCKQETISLLAFLNTEFQESMENAKRTYEILNSGENWEQYNYISK